MARKKAPEEHVNHERWLVSYADFITLLFAFFVIMYALSEVDKNKLKKFSNSVQFAFSHTGTGGTMTQGKSADTLRPKLVGQAFPLGRRNSDPGPFESLNSIVQFLENSIMSYFLRSDQAKVEVVDGGKGIVIRMPAERLFVQGSDHLRRDRIPFFEEFGAAVSRYDVGFRVGLQLDVPLGRNVVAEYDLGSRRTNALVAHIRRGTAGSKARFSSLIQLIEEREVETSNAEESRSVFEFYMSP